MEYLFKTDSRYEEKDGEDGETINLLITDREGLAKLYEQLGEVIKRCEGEREYRLDIPCAEDFDELPFNRVMVVDDVKDYYVESGLEASERRWSWGCIVVGVLLLFLAVSGIIFWVRLMFGG